MRQFQTLTGSVYKILKGDPDDQVQKGDENPLPFVGGWNGSIESFKANTTPLRISSEFVSPERIAEGEEPKCVLIGGDLFGRIFIREVHMWSMN